ncbi:hypothetical protein QR680_011409 [Steinernema hermaphroditum]|uniref:C2 domain-containing protein n=1 Tax=Steinernema hermaphroditum TaxID=289476 RepID=A0AA39MDH4_9BILA|nr:hypothetical protein QR680_011409 [Steinernema hermaphroditum]
MSGLMGKVAEKLVESKVKHAAKNMSTDESADDESDDGKESGGSLSNRWKRFKKKFKRKSDSSNDHGTQSDSEEENHSKNRSKGRRRQSSGQTRKGQVKRPRSDSEGSSSGANGSHGKRSSDGTVQSAHSENTETAVETSDGNETTSLNESDDERPSSRNNSEWETGSTTSHGSNKSLHSRRKIDLGELAKKQSESADEDAVDEDAKTVQSYNVRVRIVEGKELQGPELNPLVRVYLNGKQRTTRVRKSTDCPRWDQTLSFSFKKSLEQVCQTNIEFRVYSARRVVRDSLVGSFQCNLGAVYKQKHHTMIDKWLALTPGKKDRDEVESNDADIRGFLKVSISVYHNHQKPPVLSLLRSQKRETDADEDVLFRAQLLKYILRFRIYKFCQLPDFVRYPHEKAPVAPGHLAVEVQVGNFKVMTSFVSVSEETVAVNEELHIPIMWPTVVKDIRFRLISLTQRRKKRVLCTEFIALKYLCHSGTHGFLPTYGPSFLSFYGPETTRSYWAKSDVSDIRDGVWPGSSYCGRVLIDIRSSEGSIYKTHRYTLSSSAVAASEIVHSVRNYTLFCTFFACNAIDPEFRAKSIQFTVSVGAYGNPNFGLVPKCSNRTLAVMPAYDTSRFYTMPWGNHKPVCEIPCSFEDVTHRVEKANALIRIAEMLEQCMEAAKVRFPAERDDFEFTSILLEGLEEAAVAFDYVKADYIRPATGSVTDLDQCLKTARVTQLGRFVEQFAELKFDRFTPDELYEIGTQQLGAYAAHLRKLAYDVQISLPDVMVQMVADSIVVAHAKIPIVDFFYTQTPGRCGRNCGEIKQVPLQWPTKTIHKLKENEVPCVLYLKLWMGPSECRTNWEKAIEPGQLKYYAELFENQRRPLLSSTWKPTEGNPHAISDESGIIELSEGTVRPPWGWVFKGRWTLKRCHDMWVGCDAGHMTFEDEAYEVQRKTNNKWLHHLYTTYHGDEIDQSSILRAPSGWQYQGDWVVDLHRPGDADGWSYLGHPEFWVNPSTIDTDEREYHLFRRRRKKRLRSLCVNADYFEDFNAFKKHLDENGWEYAHKFGQPVHMQMMPGDKFRRRRMVRELGKEQSSAKLHMRIMQGERVDESLSPRIYEIHNTASEFQLRAYIFWARELFTSKKMGPRAFVRIIFMNRSQNTQIIQYAINPVWNETLIFNRVIIPGGVYSLKRNPPAMIVEVRSEELNETESFLGRFEVQPIVINRATDRRAVPKWYPLNGKNGNTRGELLAMFELFQNDPAMRCLVPLLPFAKHNARNRFEVPPTLRPNFVSYTVQFLCWGVRNLSRFQLLSVRSPFVEIIIGDCEERTDPIADAKQNPNFSRPLLTFPTVVMPELLLYAPPITLNLYDQRSFGRQPLVGVCIIKNFSRYICDHQIRHSRKEELAWNDFDRKVAREEKLQRAEIAQLPKADTLSNQNIKIDWWCKYYASIGLWERAPGFARSNTKCLLVFDKPLEDVGDYCGFEDFLDTFVFRKLGGSQSDSSKQQARGELKGRLFIRPLEKKCNAKSDAIVTVPGVEFSGPVRCVIRVYIVRAYDLISRRRSGGCDPYISVRCGNSQKRRFKNEYCPQTAEPIFGQLVEFDAVLPHENKLVISIMDKRQILADEEIGSTQIDLENRLLTKYRATVGLSQCYTIHGPLKWRDQLTPLETLRRYCVKMQFPPPVIRETEKDVGIELHGSTFWLSEIEASRPTSNKEVVGRPLQRVALHVMHQLQLVPEHVETRPLYNSINPDTECGKLEVFVDIFPRPIGSIPPALDIKPRKPTQYQLRVAIFKTKNVILSKRSFGKPAADLYVKCYLNGMEKAEKTDIHYRVLEGEASFNWRFVFDFDYDSWEQMITVYKRTRLFRKKIEEKVEPILVVQIWDNNKFKKDKYIGQLKLNLLSFEEGQMESEDMPNVFYEKDKKRCCCVRLSSFCVRTRCCTKRRRKAKLQLPRAPIYVPRKVDSTSLFDQKSVRGWWPCLTDDLPEEQVGKPFYGECYCIGFEKYKCKKKNDDFVEDVQYVTGLIEMDVSLLRGAEAQKNPVGRQRKKPNHSPFLSKPDRPKMDNFWCTSRLTAGSRFFWNRCGWQCICTVFCVIMLGIIIFSLIWNFPEIITSILIR